MLDSFLDKVELRKRKKAYERSEKLRAKNDIKPPNHKGWSKMINTGLGGLNQTVGNSGSREHLVNRKELLLNMRKEIVDDEK